MDLSHHHPNLDTASSSKGHSFGDAIGTVRFSKKCDHNRDFRSGYRQIVPVNSMWKMTQYLSLRHENPVGQEHSRGDLWSAPGLGHQHVFGDAKVVTLANNSTSGEEQYSEDSDKDFTARVIVGCVSRFTTLAVVILILILTVCSSYSGRNSLTKTTIIHTVPPLSHQEVKPCRDALKCSFLYIANS